MTAASRPRSNGGPTALVDGEPFAKFFGCWISEQSRDLAALREAAAADADAADLRRLVDRVRGHYEHYYRAKSAAAAANVRAMFAPSWISTTESLYLWCGGWRPTAALHLLYSKSGAQLEAQLPAFLDGAGSLRGDDLGCLSADQLRAADQLQRRTIGREREIEEAAAAAQESLATGKMVELAAGAMEAAGLEREMEAKAEGMRRVLEMADGLRLETMRAVVVLLRPPQDVHFLLAAAELHLAVHHLGCRKDAHGPSG